jgi:hypothetical protein
VGPTGPVEVRPAAASVVVAERGTVEHIVELGQWVVNVLAHPHPALPATLLSR